MTSTRNPQVLGFKIKSKRLPKKVADWLRRFLNRLFGFQRFNAIYAALPPCEPQEFAHKIVESLGVRLELRGEPLDIMPTKGSLLVIANHPLGMIDGFIVDVLLSPNRPDCTLMAVYVLGAIPDNRDRLILVGPRGMRSQHRHSVQGWREAYRSLLRGGAMVVFPAGGIARFQWRRLSIADQSWSPHIAALARRSGATVLPLYIHGRSRWLFHLFGALCPPLQDILTFGELEKMRGRTIPITIGRPIHAGDLSRFPTDEEGIAFLRRETEMLARS